MTVIVTQSRGSYSGTVNDNHIVFREFVNNWTNTFALAGWVNTEASGSINLTTVSASAANAYSGYQVWRFNDELHNNGYPVYIRISYGAPSAVTRAGFGFQVGFYHDGSGSVSSPATMPYDAVGKTAFYPVGLQYDNASTLYTNRVCCISGSDLVGILGDDASGRANAFFIERTKDATGNVTTEGIVVAVAFIDQTTPSWRQSYLLYNQDTGSCINGGESYPTYLLSPRQGIFDNTATVAMFIPMLRRQFGFPSRVLGMVTTSSLSPGITHNITLFNTSSTYYVSTNTAPNNVTWRGSRADTSEGVSGFRWIMRYD